MGSCASNKNKTVTANKNAKETNQKSVELLAELCSS